MRRSPIVVIATIAGVAGVLSYPTSKPRTVVASPPTAGAPTTSTRPTTGSSSAAGHNRAARSSGAAGSGTGSSSTGRTRSATGKVIAFGYGQLSVKVTMTGTRITNVSLASLSTIDSYSQQIAQQVVPMLRHEVLSAQSARIQLISGASYTTDAYATSVQAALASLHA